MSNVEHDVESPLTPLEKSRFEDYIDRVLYDARLVIFSGEISEYQVLTATRILESMVIKRPKIPIKVVLCSVGGDAYDGLLLFGTIRDIVRRGTPVHIEIRGVAASMAAIVLQGASKRTASKYSRFLLHESSVKTGDKMLTVVEQEEMASESKKLNEMLCEILAERTGKRTEKIESLTKRRDYWMSAAEAKKFGLIDSYS